MSEFRHDQSGRSTTRRKSKREAAVNKPRGPFVYYEIDLLRSAAWQALGINARRVIERIQIEHLRHGGRENGRLPVTFCDFEAAGIGRRFITLAVIEAEALGFIERTSRGRKRFGANPGAPSTFRLTFMGTITAEDIWPPSDEWRRFQTPEMAEHAKAEAIATARAAEAAARAKRAQDTVEDFVPSTLSAGG